MQKQKKDLKRMVQIALLAAIMMVMSVTPLGYIPLPFMKATIMHVPVIIAACLLSPKVGAGLGALFGFTSIIVNTISPSITSFVFTPFYSINEQFNGSLWSIVVAMLPRILMGVISGYVFILLKKLVKSDTVSLVAAGITGSMVNTIGVMSLVYIFFGEQYALAGGKDPQLILGVILGVIGTNGVAEAVIAAVLNVAVCKAVFSVFNNKCSCVKS